MVGRWADVVRAYVRRRIALALCVVIVFAAGLATGALALDYVAEEGRTALASEVESLLDVVGGKPAAPPGDVLRTALTEYVVKIPVLSGVLGLSIVGAPAVLALIFVRGFVLGFTAMFLIDGWWLSGAVLAAVALLPHNLLAVPATLAAGTGALGFSAAAARTLLGRRDVNMYHQFATTLFVLLFSAAALVGAAFVEAYVSPVLMGVAAQLFPAR